MKTAKKVLAIVLAAVLVLGTVAVAASAYDFAPDQKLYFRLNADVRDAEGAREVKDLGREAAYSSTKPTTAQKKNQTADFAEYMDLSFDEHEYADKTKTIYVQPGQIVWVTVGYRSTGNIYPNIFEAAISYTDLFLSTTNTAKCNPINEDSVYGGVYSGTVTYNTWALFNAKTRAKYGQSNGDHSVYMACDADAGSMDGAMVADLDEDMVSFPLYVDPDAEDGATGTIYMADNFTSAYYNYVAGYEDEDISVEPFEICGDALDYSETILNFKVGEEPAGVDTTELEKAMTAFEALDENAYTADSWAVAAAAYADAEDAMTSDDQDVIDAAAEALNDAMGALVTKAVLDYTRIDTALGLVPSDLSSYTASTAAAVTSAAAAATTAKATATEQAELDNAAAALEDAIDALKVKADMTALNAALSDAAAADTSKWNDASKAALATAVAEGQALVAQASECSDQAAVAAATKKINDALANFVYAGADYTAVNTAKAAVPADLSAYTAASVAAVNDAVNAVVDGLDATQQATVDGFAKAINDAVAALKLKADTTALAAAVAAAGNAKQADYAANVWTSIQGYVADADNYIGKDLAAEDAQAAIDTLTTNLNNALNNKLGAADYSAVDAAIAKIPADLSGYTDATVAALNDAVSAVVRDLKADKQGDVDKMASDIEAAIDALEVKKADLTALNAAIANADATVDSADKYTEDSYKAYADAYAAAKALADAAPDYTAQDDVDAAAKALNDAVAALAYLGADWTELNKVVADAEALVRDNYTDASLAAFDSAFASTLAMYNNKADYDINDQLTINAQAAAGKKAFEKLVLKGADFTAIDALVAQANALVRDNYTAESLAAFDAAFADTLAMYNNKSDYTILDQADVNAQAANEDAFDALVLKDADYSMVERWAGKVSANDADKYTPASWAAYANAIAAVEYGLKADKQMDVDNMADAIYQAYKGLVLAGAADYSAVDAAIEEFEALDASLYTADTVAAVEAAIDAVVEGLNANHQAEVDAMAQAINDAIDALELIPVEKDADYTAVDEAIAAFAEYDQKLYTVDSVKAVKDAIAAVVRDLKESDQAKVDAMAKAINDAIDGLELLPPPVVNGMVKNVEYTETSELVKEYKVTVEGRAFKIQFVDASGNTITFSRVDVPEVITSYTEDGTVCDDMDRALAYEVWTVSLGLQSGNYTVIARNAKTGWESLDLGYNFNVVRSTKYATADSIKASVESANIYDQVPVEVRTGKDVLKVQILINGAEFKTFDKSVATADGDQLVFNTYAKIYYKGANTITAKIKTADGWTTTDLSTTVEGVK